MHPNAARLSGRAFHHSPTCVALGLFCSFACASVAAAADQVVQSTTLVERCRSVADDRASVAAQLCDSYVRGFLAGAHAAGWLYGSTDPAAQETFSERAYRTRTVRVLRSSGPQSCLPEGTSMQELVAQLLAYADARPTVNGVSDQQLLDGMLRAAYPCGRRPAGGKA